MTKWKFVSSGDIPPEITEPIAIWAHKRGCGAFDGQRAVAGPAFNGSHRKHDQIMASISVADLCNALHITVDDLLTVKENQ